MTAREYVACINAVLARYPDACVEYPTKLCSVSEYPGGREVSRRCSQAKATWIDAFQRLGKADVVGRGGCVSGSGNLGQTPSVRVPSHSAAVIEAKQRASQLTQRV
jgi:hypothetical protein